MHFVCNNEAWLKQLSGAIAALCCFKPVTPGELPANWSEIALHHLVNQSERVYENHSHIKV